MTVRINSLAAVVLADGSVDKKRNTVSFTEGKELVERLVKDFSSLDNLDVKWKTEPQINSFRARAYNKKLVDLLLERISISRTRPYNKFPFNPNNTSLEIPKPLIPKECFKNIEEAREFLRGYISCDGGPEFSIYKRSSGQLQITMGIKIGCNNKFLRKQLENLLQKFKLNFREVADGIEMRSIDDIRKFANEIKFFEESKVRRSKKFNGFQKNSIVKLFLLCSFLTQNGNWINKNFKSKDELENFLKDCLILIEQNDKKKLRNLLELKLNKEINIDSILI